LRERQASASREPSQSSAFRFKADDDSFGLLKDSVEDVNRRYRACSLLVLDRYKKTDLAVVLKIKSQLNARVFDLVFNAVPVNGCGHLDIGGGNGCADFEVGCDTNHKSDHGVFANVTEFIEGVERIIPSCVTLEGPKERLDFRWQILASTANAVLEVGNRVPEGEGDVSRIGVTAGGQMTSESRMIEAGSGVFNDLGSKHTPPEWKSLSELDFEDFVNAIRIRLSDLNVWLFTEKLVNLGFEVIEMFLCSAKPQMGAVENRRGAVLEIITHV
jgi:hypothetical protein